MNFPRESRLCRGKALKSLVVLGPMSSTCLNLREIWYQVLQRSQVDSTDSKAYARGHGSTCFLFLDIRQRLGKRPHSPEKAFSGNPVVRREPFSDVHSRLGVPRQDVKGLYSDTREKKSGW